jgi:hypothetical protein
VPVLHRVSVLCMGGSLSCHYKYGDERGACCQGQWQWRCTSSPLEGSPGDPSMHAPLQVPRLVPFRLRLMHAFRFSLGMALRWARSAVRFSEPGLPLYLVSVSRSFASLWIRGGFLKVAEFSVFDLEIIGVVGISWLIISTELFEWLWTLRLV